MLHLIAEMKLEDVFKSTQENFREGPDGNRLLAVLLGAAGVILLLALFSQRRKRTVVHKAVNHQGKLLREVIKQLPLRSAELKQLKLLAEQESCSSPLVLLLCPSILARGLGSRTPKSRRMLLGRVARKVGVTR